LTSSLPDLGKLL